MSDSKNKYFTPQDNLDYVKGQLSGKNPVSAAPSGASIYNSDGSFKYDPSGVKTDFTAAANEAELNGDPELAAIYRQKAIEKNNALGLGFNLTNEYDYFLKKPEYKNAYKEQMERLLGDIGSSKFEFDPDKSSVWKSVKAEHEREAERATEDAMGAYATMTGGNPSSYAVTAATQAGAYERSKATDRLQQIYNDEYSRYLTELQNKQNLYSMYSSADNSDYSRWLDEYSREYGAAMDRTENARYIDGIRYQRERDRIGDSRYEDETAEDRYRYGLEFDENKRRYEEERGYAAGRDYLSDEMNILNYYITLNDVDSVKAWFKKNGYIVPEGATTKEIMDYALSKLKILAG